MSQEDSNHSTTESLTAEFRDGQLQIVEVTPFDKSSDDDTETIQVEADGETGKYMQVYDSGGKEMLQLDLLNLTFVRCEGEDGDRYRLVTSESSEGGGEYMNTDDTVTCVLQSSDGEEQEDPEYVVLNEDQEQEDHQSYVMVEAAHEQTDSSSYVMVEGEQGIVLLQSDASGSAAKKKEEKPQTTYDILERAKALRKAKRLLEESLRPQRGRGHRLKPRHAMPAAQELLASPHFKLFLYSCKMCSFKCNAIRELTAHRSSSHGGGGGTGATAKRRVSAVPQLQCPRCPYRATSTSLLLQHAQHHVVEPPSEAEQSPEAAISSAAPGSVLVCGACGFESVSRPTFRRHIARAHRHGLNTSEYPKWKLRDTANTTFDETS